MNRTAHMQRVEIPLSQQETVVLSFHPLSLGSESQQNWKLSSLSGAHTSRDGPTAVGPSHTCKTVPIVLPLHAPDVIYPLSSIKSADKMEKSQRLTFKIQLVFMAYSGNWDQSRTSAQFFRNYLHLGWTRKLHTVSVSLIHFRASLPLGNWEFKYLKSS